MSWSMEDMATVDTEVGMVADMGMSMRISEEVLEILEVDLVAVVALTEVSVILIKEVLTKKSKIDRQFLKKKFDRKYLVEIMFYLQHWRF